MYFSWDWDMLMGDWRANPPLTYPQSQLKYEINLSHVFLKKNII
jgi:hypothetical protein